LWCPYILPFTGILHGFAPLAITLPSTNMSIPDSFFCNFPLFPFTIPTSYLRITFLFSPHAQILMIPCLYIGNNVHWSSTKCWGYMWKVWRCVKLEIFHKSPRNQTVYELSYPFHLGGSTDGK
jgi:hypothetical protein